MHSLNPLTCKHQTNQTEGQVEELAFVHPKYWGCGRRGKLAGTTWCTVGPRVSERSRVGIFSKTLSRSTMKLYQCQFSDFPRLSTKELMLLNCGEDSWEFLGQQGDQTSQSKGNQPRIFTGRTDTEAKAPIFWPPDAKSQFTEKDCDTGKDWRQKEKGAAEDKMIRQHHPLSGHEFEQTPGDSEGQGSLACCSPWGCRESDTTERLNDNVKVNGTIHANHSKCWLYSQRH